MTVKKISWILIATACFWATLTQAETCPNLNGKKFNSIWEYNNYKNSVAAQYTMPDMNGQILSFPITFGASEYVYITSKTNVGEKAPFTGDTLRCYVAWTGNNYEQQDDIITINHPVKTTSSDWDAMDTQTAECDNPSGDNTCTFDRVN